MVDTGTDTDTDCDCDCDCDCDRDSDYHNNIITDTQVQTIYCIVQVGLRE